jgi:hypothetical protein
MNHLSMGANKMESIRFGRWELICDPDLTRKSYAAVTVGGPEGCGCEPCFNFAAARQEIYKPEVLELFEKLGISPDREVEIYHMARLSPGRHLYGGWFHFVGSIVTGADAAKQIAENTWQPALEKTSDSFSLGFSSRLELVREQFKNLPLVQLEFTAEVPWILDKAEPNQ